jgi:phospholipase D1/2
MYHLFLTLTLSLMMIQFIRQPTNRYHATHPFNATFSPHKKTRVRIFLCGAAYFAAAADAMMAARDTIMIADWFFSCEVYLKRAKGHPLAAEWRLDNLLQRKAREGVKVYILIWKDLMTNCGSQIAKKRMEALHDNIHVILHRAPMQKSVMMWTHHQKFVCVDQAIAFVGGIDLAYGRFDTPSHPLLDVPVNGCTLFPGMDYTNPQIDGGGRSEEGVLRPFHDLLDRKTQPRMPWQDIHCCINGEAARDVSLNFVQRWNEHRAVIQLRPLPIWPTIHTATWDFPHGWDDAQVQVLRSLSGWRYVLYASSPFHLYL